MTRPLRLTNIKANGGKKSSVRLLTSLLVASSSVTFACSQGTEDLPGAAGSSANASGAGAMSGAPAGGTSSGGVASAGASSAGQAGSASGASSGAGGAGSNAGGTGGGSNGGAAGSGGAVSGGAGGAAGAGGAVEACDPKDQGPAPSAVNVQAKGAAFTGTQQVVVETDPGLSGATIFRPKELKPGARYPIVAWAQGGCSQNGTSNPEFNGEIASHGYLMIADGTPNGQGNRAQTTDYKAMGAPLVKYLDWAIAENDRPCSQYYRALDTTKIAVFGWSCGGLMTEGAATDPRVTTFMINNSGMLSFDQKIADAMHTPGLILLGGQSDAAYPNGMNDFAKIGKIPLVVASVDVGHGGTYQADNGGSFAKVDLAWLDWWLKGDEGPNGKGLFLGAGCGLCSDSAWTIQSKNFP